MASRKHDADRRQIDRSNIPFSDADISHVAQPYTPPIIAPLSSIGRYSREDCQAVDTYVVRR